MIKYFVVVSLTLSLLTGIVKYSFESLNALKLQNIHLKVKNKALAKKNLNIKQKVKQRNKHLISQKIKRIKQKLAKASATAIPIVGNVASISITAYEVQQLCNDLKEYKEFEKDLFEEDISKEESLDICGHSF